MFNSLASLRRCLTKGVRHASVNALTAAPRRRGRPRKSEIACSTPLATSKTTSQENSTVDEVKIPAQKRATRKRKSTDESSGTPPRLRLARPAQTHHDLLSFLEHAARHKLSTTTSVYKGTYFEYLVADVFKRYDFTLNRTGRANDLGIDLIGTWRLPQDYRELKVLVQCKCSKPSPSMVRELEGAYVGAPAGWRGPDVMGILVSAWPATEGVRASLQRSRLPLGFVQITLDGVPKQFLWNHVAKEANLAGVSVTSTYNMAKPSTTGAQHATPSVSEAISLLWMGKPWKLGMVSGSS